jgi:hypothetical protein
VCLQVVLMEEPAVEWRDVPIRQFAGLYEVSSDGRVRSKDRKTSDGRNVKGRELKNTKNSAGYKVVTFANNNFRYSIVVHKLVAITYGVIFHNEHSIDELVINHKDGNKLNNCVANLEACTQSENVLHAYRTGLKQTHSGPKTKTMSYNGLKINY